MYMFVHLLPTLYTLGHMTKTKKIGLNNGIRYLSNTMRSTAFLAMFTTLVQAGLCTSKILFNSKHPEKVAAFLSGWSILLEKGGRKAELALYVLPRAVEVVVARLRRRYPFLSFIKISDIVFSISLAILTTLIQ